jgi:hypothetical protein
MSINYDDLAHEWLTYTDREFEIKKDLKNLKKAKNGLGDTLKEYMKTQGMEDYTTEHGTILFTKSVKKPTSCNKKTVKENLDDIDWNKMNDSDKVTEHIFSKLPAKCNEGLKKQKVRKTVKTKKESKDNKKEKRINY